MSTQDTPQDHGTGTPPQWVPPGQGGGGQHTPPPGYYGSPPETGQYGSGQYGNGQYGGAPYGQYGGQYGGPPTRMSPDSERSWAVGAHLSSFAAAYVALGFLGPLVCMLMIGDRSPYARRHAVEALNFNLSWLIYAVVSAVLVVIGVGILMLIGLGIAYVVLVIMGAVAAGRGEDFRYPLTLRMVS